MANRDFNRIVLSMHIGAIASASNAAVLGSVQVPCACKVLDLRVKDTSAFTASASVQNSITIKSKLGTAASATVGAVSFLTTASGGTGNLTARVPKSSLAGDTGVSLTAANVDLPAGTVLDAISAKVGSGNSMTDVYVDLICEPMTA